ncbi:MAG: NAD-dependent epimerase/dehydratase family protein [Deltaproteobacteria bacterium]|nr:NAD-dependent epimerase/dehydratase family protein [Deltaproteobacteria bacterium]
MAWEGLPHYQELFHIERNLINDYFFLKSMIEQGLKRLTVTGTCYEYGLRDGCLSENIPTCPTTCYGLAKDTLRRFLEALQPSSPFNFKWTRLFFMHGPGQNPNSLIPLVDLAVKSKTPVFDMSGGEQLRDYLPVEKTAELIVKVSLQSRYNGIFNICSGRPISVRRLIEQRIEEQGGRLKLNLGALPYPKHEPMAFWGDVSRLNMAIQAYEEEYGNGHQG